MTSAKVGAGQLDCTRTRAHALVYPHAHGYRYGLAPKQCEPTLHATEPVRRGASPVFREGACQVEARRR